MKVVMKLQVAYLNYQLTTC